MLCLNDSIKARRQCSRQVGDCRVVFIDLAICSAVVHVGTEVWERRDCILWHFVNTTINKKKSVVTSDFVEYRTAG